MEHRDRLGKRRDFTRNAGFHFQVKLGFLNANHLQSPASIFIVSQYTAKKTKATRKTLHTFLQVTCNKTIAFALRHVANGRVFDLVGYGYIAKKRKPSHVHFNAILFDYVLYVLLEVIDIRH